MNIQDILQDLSKNLPKFPDGRIDYTHSDKAVVLTCFVEYENKILLLKRSEKVGTYKNMWNSVAGYIDEAVPIEQKVLEELREELGIEQEDIAKLIQGNIYEFYDKDIQKTWIIVPFMAKLNRMINVTLDWEHTEYRWIYANEMSQFSIVPNLDKSLQHIIVE